MLPGRPVVKVKRRPEGRAMGAGSGRREMKVVDWFYHGHTAQGRGAVAQGPRVISSVTFGTGRQFAVSVFDFASYSCQAL